MGITKLWEEPKTCDEPGSDWPFFLFAAKNNKTMKTQKTGGNSLLNVASALLLGLSMGGSSGSVLAAGGSGSVAYVQTSLVSDETAVAPFMDTNLVNPWGLLAGPEGHLVVADNHAGVATFYRPSGHPVRLKVVIPAPSGDMGAPTDLGLNWSERDFLIVKGKRHDESVLLFATEDGTIAGWNPEVDANQAVIAVDNSAAGAIYKSMALGATRQGPRLYAANFGQGVVEMYDGRFHLVKSFTDPALASANFVPFGLRIISGHLMVTFAFKAAPDDGDETAGTGLGYVDEFDLAGNLVRRFASRGTLNAPWGLALAPHNFGKFGGALLVGNFGDGTINAYHPGTGAFLGQLADPQGNAIQIAGLWGLAVGPGSDGPSLYFTAGPDDENHGLLGILRPERHSH